jgi:glycosyltransferase involved in cell wall biosynthesis
MIRWHLCATGLPTSSFLSITLARRPAWRLLDGILPLRIAGSGPMAAAVQEEAASNNATIQFLGPVPVESVYTLIGEATVLVLQSEWYEHFPWVLIEAFAKGTPSSLQN